MDETEPRFKTIEAEELKSIASGLIDSFEKSSRALDSFYVPPKHWNGPPDIELADSYGFYHGENYFVVGRDIFNGMRRLRILRWDKSGGYGEDHLYIETPDYQSTDSIQHQSDSKIEYKGYLKGLDWQPKPDYTYRNTPQAVEEAERIIAQLTLQEAL